MRSASTSSSTAPPNLTWAEFLSIRRAKRRWELTSTIPMTFVGLGAGVAYFGSLEADAAQPIFGIEPMWVYAAATMGCMGLGYLIGPTLGGTLWRTTHRRMMSAIELKDKEFHARIVKHRVDPSRQSAMNPVPDYYGEKIGSLHDYRRWLRDQAKFNKKAMWPED
ncbi:mitochondrial import protein Pam17 [Dacryopinax primogenitus]|uniref:Presequence translocated-associated motor subunit PAM17 n=1 Tax=Dacryopinax primogenitus (strain DJM 731) TaxID=1858805 RepID=M5FT31_DACPD|nr:mitochondrial import protein Pam17 [Dacryopinax primogenitus]EJU00706.1 mitochondrial import protein Pam17 [Dacryopinax primogenitus]